MAFGAILVGSLMGLLAAAAAALMGQSVWVVLAVYLGTSVLAAGSVFCVLMVRTSIASRRKFDTGAQGFAVKAPE